jgi:hypothetical protein
MKRKFKMSKDCLVSLSNMVMRGKYFFTPQSPTKWHSLKYYSTCWIRTSNSSVYEEYYLWDVTPCTSEKAQCFKAKE